MLMIVKSVTLTTSVVLITEEKKMSAVWKYFMTEMPASTLAKCKICDQKVSRGGVEPGTYNTSNLIKHLKSKRD